MTDCSPEGCKECKERHEIFYSLGENELDQIDGGRIRIRYKAGEIIFKQGAPCHNIYCITNGLVKLFIENGSHSNMIIGLVRPVDYIFNPGVFVDQKHHFSAAACEETIACIIDLKVIHEIMSSNPDFAREFIRKISHQTIRMLEKLTSYNHKQVFGRVADTLLYLTQDIYQSNPCLLSLSRQELAEITGITKESFIRVLKRFKEENIIRIDGNYLEILNFPMLEMISKNG